MIITIDGPTASGKSTVARKIAKKLRIFYLNTGLLYRGLAYILVNKFNYDLEKLKSPLESDLNLILDPTKFIYEFDGENEYLKFDQKNITSLLKNKEIDFFSSIISAKQNVRKELLNFQREFANHHDIVIEGRDCGSVVFSCADYKFFLTANIEVRAYRWQKYMESKEKFYLLDECIKIVSDRDERDKTRKISPLIIPKDAIIIDSTNLSENEVVDLILKSIKN